MSEASSNQRIDNEANTACLSSGQLQPDVSFMSMIRHNKSLRGMQLSHVVPLLFQWIKTELILLMNAGSLIGTTIVTSGLGFVYWWVAARWFSPQSVGLGSAVISAMTLLSIICMLGLGTLLIGELPRYPGKEGSLISTALLVAGGAGGCCGILFALIASFIAPDFQVLRASLENILLFAMGVSVTTITLVLDQALIGLLRGDLQLWRNTLFSIIKLVVIFGTGLFLAQKAGLTIYGTWMVGNLVSLAFLLALVGRKGIRVRGTYWPEWGLLRKLGSTALQHHIFNLILQLPPFVLPVLVTVLLSATVNAWFYVSFMLANFVFGVSYALTIILYAIGSANATILAQKARLTLSLGIATAIVANCIYLLATRQVLGIFSHAYAEQASVSLRILSLGAFPILIKDHFVAIHRIQNRMAQGMLPVVSGTILELGIAALGAHLDGLTGLSLGWLTALVLEAMYMSPSVYKTIFRMSEYRGGS